MVHTFGRGQGRVTTSHRFPDEFIANRRHFNGGDVNDNFFRQTPLGRQFGSVYDAPTALRNILLLHASDRQFTVAAKIGNAVCSSRASLVNSDGGGDPRKPVIRNISIKFGKREADGPKKKTSDKVNVLQKSSLSSLSAIRNGHRKLSPPVPPSFRRHFNLSCPLISKSPIPPAHANSSGGNSADEEYPIRNEVGSDQICTDIAASRRNCEIDKGKVRPSPPSLYDTPWSVFPVAPLAIPEDSLDDTSAISGISILTQPFPGLDNDSIYDGNSQDSDHSQEPILPSLLIESSQVSSMGAPASDNRIGTEHESSNSTTPTPETHIDEIENFTVIPARDDCQPAEIDRISIRSVGGDADQQDPVCIEPGEAVDCLKRIVEILQKVVFELCCVTTGNWRRLEYLEQHMDEIRNCCKQTVAALKDFHDFSSGLVSNSKMEWGSIFDDRNLAEHLTQLAEPVENSLKLLMECQTALDEAEWSVDLLANENSGHLGNTMDQLVAVAKQAPQNARHVASFLRANISRIIPNAFVDDPSESSSVSSDNEKELSGDSPPEQELTNSTDGNLSGNSGNGNGSSVSSEDAGKSCISDSSQDIRKSEFGESFVESPSFHFDGLFEDALKSQLNGLTEEAQISQVNGLFEVAQKSKFNSICDEALKSEIGGLLEDGKISQSSGFLEEAQIFEESSTSQLLGPQTSQSNGTDESPTFQFVGPQTSQSNGTDESPTFQLLGPQTSQSNGTDESPTFQFVGPQTSQSNGTDESPTFQFVGPQKSESSGSSNKPSEFNGLNGFQSDFEASSSGFRDTDISILDDYDFAGDRNETTDDVSSAERCFQDESILSNEDRQILQFYSPQVENHVTHLSKAIDDFLLSVEENRPPRVFVQLSKLVILGAHKLVYVGDSVAKCLQWRELADQLRQCTDELCDVLKYCVTATRQAVLQFPSIPAIQAMVDSVVSVSREAYQLKFMLGEAADL